MANILHFSIGGVQGAIPLDESMYLVRMAAFDTKPSDSPGVSGTLNLHGTRVLVYSLRSLFGLPKRSPCLNDSLIIAKTGKSTVALWVDETYVVRDNMGNEIPDVPPEYSIPGIIFTKELVFISDLTLFLESWNTGYNEISIPLTNRIADLPKTQSNYFSGLDESPDIGKIRKQLSDRARDLARLEGGLPEPSSLEVIKFRLVYRDYAAEMRFVREVVLTREITPVPTAPDHIIGVCPVRGEIIPLVDLRVLLSIPERGLTDLNQVIVLTDGHITFGILADQITGISLLPIEELQKAGPEFAPGQPNYIFGIMNTGLIVINAAAILKDPKMIVDQSGELEHSVATGKRAV
ncbi:chemotaxis protein CheW [Methanospirillum lacunae]|uniref:Chemotaxis protein CheW n=1 Tax=Methanospirillum lacunae TaxID=668570 RepID=A0A2V2MZ07_9EURY|nr:chemotaxis protein CheW [Methanospirillum lacunae]PWR73172.1 chemotaxis protein CheW [Methanospirillum lacunae]